MKKIGFLIFVIALVVGCVIANFVSWGKSEGSVLKFTAGFGGETGSGRLASEVRDLSEFKGLDVGGVFHVEVVAGAEFSVEVEADDNLLQYIETEVRGGDLHISLDRKVKTENPLRVRVSAPRVENLEASGASKVNVSGLKNERLTIDASGASGIVLAGETGDLIVDVSGASKIDAAGLNSVNAVIDASGASRVSLNVTGELRSEASGASSITYTGSPANVVKNTSGASSVTRR